MAPAGDTVYFPSLQRCLDGSVRLISWKTAFLHAVDLRSATRPDTNLKQFLSSPGAVDCLGDPLNAFHFASPQSKTDFESKTAPINITPTSKTYNLQEIKDDALHLSKETSIDELSALRIIILEWQSRPAAQLLDGSPLDGAAGSPDPSSSLNGSVSRFTPKSSILTRPKALPASQAASFESEESRRTRQIYTYFSERKYLLKLSELLVRSAVSKSISDDQAQPTLYPDLSKGKDVDSTSWLEQIGDKLYSKTILLRGAKSGAFLRECTGAMKDRIKRLETGSGCFKEEGGKLEVEAEWGKTLILEIIHILQIMFNAIESSATITSADTLMAWLEFVRGFAFFEKFEPPYSIQQPYVLPLQSLVAIVSLAILNLPLAVAAMQEAPENSSNSPTHRPYITDNAVIEFATVTFLEAAGSASKVASLATLAWSIILQTLRDVVLAHREAREEHQVQRAVAGFEVNSSETEEGESSATENGTMYKRRSISSGSELSIEPSIYEETLETILALEVEDDPIRHLAIKAVVDGNTFDVIINLVADYCTPFGSGLGDQSALRIRLLLLSLIRAGIDGMEYIPALILATLATLSGVDRFWDNVDRLTMPKLNPAADFLNDPVMMGIFFKAAASRYPYEALPFLKLVRALATTNDVDSEGTLKATSIMKQMKTFTQVLPPGFNDYQTTNEAENANVVTLLKPLQIFLKRNRMPLITQPSVSEGAIFSLSQDANHNGLFIPTNTLGRIISEHDPVVALWEYEYSGLQYLGRMLSSARAGSSVVDAATGFTPDADTRAEMIGLLATLVTVSNDPSEITDDGAAARRILEEASDGVERNDDIISIVLDIFEEELQNYRPQAGIDGSLDVLVSCVQFMFAISAVIPGRVWPFLAKSGLLEIEGRGGKLASIVAGTEIVTGRYEFLMGCIRLFDVLVEDSVTHTVARNSNGQLSRDSVQWEGLATGLPEKIMSKVLGAFERTLVDVFESMGNWRYAIPDEKLEIASRLLGTFDNILSYAYGIGESASLDDKITSVLASTAEHLVDVFLSSSSNDLPSQPFLRIFNEGASTPATTLYLKTLEWFTSEVTNGLKFCVTLVRVGNILNRPPSHLESLLFQASPLLTKLYVAHDSYRIPVLRLFHALVVSAGSLKEEPPSLLGHLGPVAAKSFLSVLSDFEKPLNNEELEISIWHLLSAIVSNRQQWLSVYLLTGKPPRESLKENASVAAEKGHERSLLTLALDALSDIKTLSPRKALAMLEFVSFAEDYWPWAMTDLHKHPRFLAAISGFTIGLEPTKEHAKIEHNATDCSHIRMAAFVADILGMYTLHARQLGNTSFAETLTKKLDYYAKNAVKVPSYNSSLHGNLAKNFNNKFQPFNLAKFKRSQLHHAELGPQYVYDMDLATKMLSFEPVWKGIRGNPGLAAEVERANVNLSKVEAQVALLQGWKVLATELTSILPGSENLREIMIQVAKDCLVANANSNLSVHIFENLTHVRADLAFILLQRLLETKPDDPHIHTALPSAWALVRDQNTGPEYVLTGPDAVYNRKLLQILLLALRATAHSPSTPQKASSNGASPHIQSDSPTILMTLEIITALILPTFRSLASSLHTSPTTTNPTDFTLLTALLRASFQVPGIHYHQPSLVSALAAANTISITTTLYSWSDNPSLCPNHDPIYGDLSMLFLLELSTLPQLAEHMALDGVISQLAAARLTQYLQRGVNPLGEVGHQRLYAIWARGILPLCLNLLTAVGASIAVEVSAFLASFKGQLEKASAFFTVPLPGRTSITEGGMGGALTVLMCKEAYSLALLTAVLDKVRKAGAGVGVRSEDVLQLAWDGKRVGEDVDGILTDGLVALRKRIVPVSEVEVEGLRGEELVKRVQRDLEGLVEVLSEDE